MIGVADPWNFTFEVVCRTVRIIRPNQLTEVVVVRPRYYKQSKIEGIHVVLRHSLVSYHFQKSLSANMTHQARTLCVQCFPSRASRRQIVWKMLPQEDIGRWRSRRKYPGLHPPTGRTDDNSGIFVYVQSSKCNDGRSHSSSL